MRSSWVIWDCKDVVITSAPAKRPNMVIYGGDDRLSAHQGFWSMFAACWGRSVNRMRMWCEHTEPGAHRGRRDKDMKRTQTSREAQLEGDGSAGRLICRFSPESRANNSCRCLVSILRSHKKTVLCFMTGDKNLPGPSKRWRRSFWKRGKFFTPWIQNSMALYLSFSNVFFLLVITMCLVIRMEEDQGRSKKIIFM